MSTNIKVAIKVRPLIKREKDDSLPIQWIVQENSIVSTDPETRRRGDGGFRFDHIFDMNASNLEVFDTIVKPIVDAAVNGFNGTVFAYGQTSSGKTYTMMGIPEESGIIPLAVDYMFDAITNTAGREFLLRVSYLEIYNEKVNDLLNKSATDLKLKDDGTGQVIVQCKEEITNCPENVLCIMKKGDKNRRIGETNMNERSSRSHTIFRITIESREAGADSNGAIQVSQLNLVDLAGSERARQTGATGERFKEGRHINMSLSALGLVIMQLSESQDSQKHVNFRDHKLTRLLQNSLGGNAMTAIICAVTPAALEETQCTLSFASRAKSVRNKPQVNEVMSDATLLKRYAKQLAKLQAELNKVKNENRSAEVEEMESKLQEKDRINQLLEERIELLQTKIVSGNSTHHESFKSKSKRRQTWGGPGMFNQQLPVFSSEPGLPPIKEMFEKPHRENIMQSVDMIYQTFQTAFTDFEWELFESERDRLCVDNGSDSEEEPFVTKRSKHRVTFKDDVFTIKSKNSTTPEDSTTPQTTPEKCNTSTQTATYQSPSTPKHVLRHCIANLATDYKELLEYTTLEKQLLCHENHCCTHKEIQGKTELTPEVRARLDRFNLPEENNIERIITELCARLEDVEKECKVEKDAYKKELKQIQELQTQIQNITSERNEFEYISCELRAQLKVKCTELELKNMTEENIREPEREKIILLEKQLSSITLEKQTLEHINAELRTESAKKFTELQKQIDNITSERNEYEYMHRQLGIQLTGKSLELEELKKDPETVRAEMETILFERNECQRINAELSRRISELEAKLMSAEIVNQNTTARIPELEVKIAPEQITNQNATAKISELEEKIASEQIANQNAIARISELEAKIASDTIANQNAIAKISELEAKIASEQIANQNATARISELEANIASDTIANQNAITTICELEAKIASDQIANQNATARISELEAKIALDQIANQNVITTVSELESKIASEQIVNQNATARISELEANIASDQIANQNVITTVSELESKIASEQIVNQNATARISELEAKITSDEIAHQNVITIISELESKIASEQIANQNATAKISELEAKIASEQIANQNATARISELEAKIASEQISNQNTTRISELENQIENIVSEKEEFNRINTELTQKIIELESKTVTEQSVNQEAIDKISGLKQEIENIILAKDQLEDLNSQLRNELNKKTLELEERKDCDYIKENSNLKICVENLQKMIRNTQTENQTLKDQLENQSLLSCSKFSESYADVSSLMEVEKSQLEETLHLKSQELEDVRNIVQSLKTDMEILQDTIRILTTENMELTTKLTTEQEIAKQAELDLQKTIDELYARISDVTSQKISLEGDLTTLKDQLESIQSTASEASSDEQLIITYQSKIDRLTTENIELSASIAEKSRELVNIKESRSLLYDHECIYKEKVAALEGKNEYLLSENSELSTDLIDKIEENDLLKEQCDTLKNKVEQLLATKDNCLENDFEHVRVENNTLKTEIIELKSKMAILSDENTKFSNNLLETMENRNCSSSEGSSDNTLHLSTIFNDAASRRNESLREVPQEKDGEALIEQIITLQEKIKHLTRLNEKLSDLKLTSCNQCAHLREMNESRRTLKIEAKTLNQKLEGLQRKFDQKCADTEMLKSKINQNLTLNIQSNSPNVSFMDEMNVSFIEEKIQDLNAELQTLKTDHDKLSVLYVDKCDEHEQLQHGLIINTNITEDSKEDDLLLARPKENKNENRIGHIQNHIDQLRDSINDLKKNSSNFTTMFDQFNLEKADLLDEISRLKVAHEELQKITTEKTRIFENDFNNMSKEIEQFMIREKEFESQRLTLEVELEDLKAKEQSNSSLIDQLREQISSLKYELDLVTTEKNELATSAIIENKYKEELEFLKKQYEDLEQAKSQATEIAQNSGLKIQELEAYVETLQKNVVNEQCLCREFEEKSCHLEKLLQESEQEKGILIHKVQTVETDLLNVRNNLEIQFKNEFDSLSAQYEQRIKESETNLEKLNDTLNKYIDDNLNLAQELTRVRNIEEKFSEILNENEQFQNKEKLLISNNEKLTNELNDTRQRIMKELKSLKCDTNPTNLSGMSINDIFVTFLQALMSKEKEIIGSVRETFEKNQRKLEDEKQQSVDIEKRTILWAKELEAEIEKLQTELTEREREQTEYRNKISQLEHLLIESNHEKEILNEKMQALETEFNNMQIEFLQKCKVDSQQEEAFLIAKKKEKEAQETYKNKEVELESKMKSEKELYGKKMNDILRSIESYKTMNLELNSTVEGLEANEKQLKNIIEANSIEIRRKDQNIEKLNAELEQLTEAYNEINQTLGEKAMYIEEITAVLKVKCDTLSEYKTKCETVIPEYEILKERVRDQEITIRRYKEEIETAKKDRETQLQVIKDTLNTEEIKNAGLTKQLNELSNRNLTVIEELNELKEKYEELQQVNAKLERKLRDSTSKIKAQAEIEEAKELNRQLQNNLEGASNRITELQEIKSQTLKELADLRSAYELVLQENAETKNALSLYKSKYNISSLTTERDQYNALLLEKNKIALELEDKKVILTAKDVELKECANRIQQLTETNKELDTECEDYAGVIRERDSEISKLEEKLHSRLTENTIITELEQKLTNRGEENEKLRDRVEALKMRLDMEQKESQELRTKLDSYKRRLDSLSQESIKSGKILSPNLHETETELIKSLKEKLRFLEGENRKLKDEIREFQMKLKYNTQNENTSLREGSTKKHLELGEYEEKYQQLKKKIHELELQLVSKNGKIATLEIQIQSENFPYQQKCKDLEEHLLAFRNKNAKLVVEMRKLQRTVHDINTWECDVCRRWRVNRKDQSCQTIPVSTDTVRFNSTNSGVVDIHVKMQKLEREKALMRDLCRSRSRRIKDLENKISELEA